jgi:hypothetical protein
MVRDETRLRLPRSDRGSKAHEHGQLTAWRGAETLTSLPDRLGIAISRLGILLVCLGLIDSSSMRCKKGQLV